MKNCTAVIHGAEATIRIDDQQPRGWGSPVSRVQAIRSTRAEVLVRQAAKRHRAKLAEERRIFWRKAGAFVAGVVYFTAIGALMWALLAAPEG